MQRALGVASWKYYQAMGWGAGQFSALIAAAYAIAAGAADVVLCYRGHLRQQQRFWVAGAGDARHASGDLAFSSPYGAPGGAARFALWARRYMHDAGATEEDLAAVVLTCREHAQLNPRAVWHGSPLTKDDYFASPYIASPLRLLDCDMPVDGAVAVILSAADRAPGLPHMPVYIESLGHATGRDPSWDQWENFTDSVSVVASRQLWSRTSLTVDDVDVAQTYDGFSYLTLCWLEDLGFCARGEAGDLIRSGATRLGGQIPICTDGGQLGGGRLHGFGKFAEAALQSRGECGTHQVVNAKVALACAGGGSVGSTILLTA
jgi:acetyl-CoA acetyltransferase